MIAVTWGKNMNTNLNIRCLVICIVLIGIVSCNNSPELPRLGNDAVILTFGDSLTRGKGAKEDESYPVILEKLTGRKVINSGISGELSEEGLKKRGNLSSDQKYDETYYLKNIRLIDNF